MNTDVGSTPSRFVGIDLHKHFVVIAAVDALQQIVLKPQRIPLDNLPAWAKTHLNSDDAVVLEATTNAWTVYDLLAPLVARCVVANPLQVKWFSAAAVKTDKQDALRLARLLAANLVPEVWVPPPARARTTRTHRPPPPTGQAADPPQEPTPQHPPPLPHRPASR